MSQYKLQTINTRKEYPGTLALDDVSVKFEGGKVNALIGKNGAGKSTLIKILAGAIQPSSGKILIDGNEVKLHSPSDAFNKGVATIYQELSLVPELTVAENILLGRPPKKKKLGCTIVDWAEMFRKAEAVLNSIQVDIDVKKKASQLSVAQQQVVEIAKAMSFNPSVLMLDEPTSALAMHETKNLFKLIKKLAKSGVAVIYITHRLQELNEIADNITVLRDGKYIGYINIKEATPEKIIHMMFGEVVPKQRPTNLKAGTEPILEINHLNKQYQFSDVSFTLNRGEVLGIAGMLGSGRTELLRAIFGAEPFDEGEIVLDGHSIKAATPMIMKKHGLAFTPEDRKKDGLVQDLSVRANMSMAAMEQISTKGFLTKNKELVRVNKLIKNLEIKVSNAEELVSSLSGGNQQKVVVGNWINTNPKVILFDEPTRGIDVQAKQQIFQIMWDLSSKGISSIFVSTELEELVEVCHRILIMKKGRIVGEVKPEEISTDELFVSCMES